MSRPSVGEATCRRLPNSDIRRLERLGGPALPYFPTPGHGVPLFVSLEIVRYRVQMTIALMGRRSLIMLLGCAAVWPLAARAQRSAVPVVGFLRDSSLGASARLLGALREGLKQAGYIEGQNVAIEARWSEGHYDQLPKLAAEQVQRQVTVRRARRMHASRKGARRRPLLNIRNDQCTPGDNR